MREVARCHLHRECDRIWTARCKACKARCRGCSEHKPCSDFGKDKTFLKAYCKACDRSRTKKQRDDAAACEREGVLLGELLYLYVAASFAQSMQLREAPSGMVKRRWDFGCDLTGISIASYLEMSQEQVRAWPLRYREMVLQATQKKHAVNPAGINRTFEFAPSAAFPGKDTPEEEYRKLFKQHMDPDGLTVNPL